MLRKPLLKIKKVVTKKPSTRKELGYERDVVSKRLKKPGTTKFNEKIEFTKEDKQRFVDFYKDKQKTVTNPLEKNINAQKLINKKIYFDRKLEIMNAERELNLKVAEKNRVNALKKRQVAAWTKKLDSLLKASGENISVKGIEKRTLDKIYSNNLRRMNTPDKKNPVKVAAVFAKTKKSVSNAFYSEIHKSIIPTEIKNMTPIQAKKFLLDISIKLIAKDRI